ncbi:ribonuclease Z [Radiobacillus deserti]|uniref:Ribonuclease Z n=1 Tax=Radiobacillus deserti TaxID=2594883 RepID=A0A516KGK4_9BACI|nr:ribonuclease Z [Radiobacillus deserti]QDP40538.1 ribonuclease Z [Radiobacillus deserti]
MDIRFLGTGAGLPSKQRNVTSIALELLPENGSVWLFDCGEATQHQILHTNIKPRKINKIFITHLHGDHIFGLPGLLSSRSFQDGHTPLTIYGPTGVKEYVETSLAISQTKLRYPLYVEELTEGVLFEDEQFTVSCKLVEHGIPSYGFTVQEKDKPGQLQPEKLRACGFPPGPLYQQIKQNESITLENGEVLYRKDFIGPDIPGRKVSIIGDTRYVEELASFVEHSDVLVHEATFSNDDEQHAYDYFHSTTMQAAKLAQNANVTKLVLTHISSRYQETDSLLNEAKSIFQATEIAHDFSVFSVRENKNT